MKTTNRKLWWFSLILPIALIGIYLVKPNWLYTAYYYVKADSFKIGEKVYIKNGAFGGLTRVSCLFRLIRPLTLSDTLNHYYTPDQVSAIRSIDCSLEPYLIPSAKLILKDSLIKFKSYGIGYFNGHYIKKIKATDNSNVAMNFISINLNEKVCIDESYNRNSIIPPNYILADSTYYIFSDHVSNKNFLSIK